MKTLHKAASLLLLIVPVAALHAASPVSVNCSKKTLQSELNKLDKSVANTVNISGNCTEDVFVSGFANLTLIGAAGASITATAFVNTGNPNADINNSTTALKVEDSKVTVKTLTINGGREGVACYQRSTCVFRDATIQGGWGGVGYQDQSGGDILGSTVIQNSLGVGLGIFGASSVNVRPFPDLSAPQAGPAPVISGHSDGGVFVLDGSFLRTDNVTISNNGAGVLALRESVIKIIGGEVKNNTYDGIAIFRGGSAQIVSDVSNNGFDGVYVGALAFAQVGGSSILNNLGLSVDCDGSTAVVNQLNGATYDDTNCP